MAVTSPDSFPQPPAQPTDDVPYIEMPAPTAPPPYMPGVAPPVSSAPGCGAYGAPQPWPIQRVRKPGMAQWKIVLLAFGGALAILAAYVAFLLLKPSPAEADVSCHDGGAIVGAQADVSVTNTTSRSQTYRITVAFTSADQSTQYATATATINDLEPGQTGTATATSWQPGKPIGGCKVLRVNSY